MIYPAPNTDFRPSGQLDSMEVGAIKPLDTHTQNITTIKIYLFGHFEVLLNGKQLQHKLWQSKQVRSLLKVLVARRGQVTSNDLLINFLWPEEDSDKAKQHLYVRISQLRKLLHSQGSINPIRSVSGGYVFMPKNASAELCEDQSLWVDVDAFEQTSDAGLKYLDQKQFQDAIEQLEVARNHYRGDYLEEDRFEDWAFVERERLHERYLVVLSELAEAYAYQGFYQRSINLCHQILNLDPWREAVFVRLMIYYYYAGDKVRALKTYERCKQVLASQLNLEPSPNTTWLANQIREGNLWAQQKKLAYPPPIYEGRIFEMPYSLGEPPFVGRDREIAWLWNLRRVEHKHNYLIIGEPGIGKTRLVDTFFQMLKNEPVETIKLRLPQNPEFFYLAWMNALNLKENLEEINKLSPASKAILTKILNRSFYTDVEMQLSDEESFLESQIIQAICEFVISKSKPIIIWIDDAHKLDDASGKLLLDLVGKVGLILTSRPVDINENRHFIEFIEQTNPITNMLTLGPWQLADVNNLLKTLGGEGILHLSEELNAFPQGNPLFLIATLQHLFKEGILMVLPDGSWKQCADIDHAIAPDVESAIANRLKTLPTQHRDIIDVIAVADGETDYEIIQNVLDRDELSVLESVNHLINQGYITEPRNFYSAELKLSHNLYGEVLYQVLPKSRKRVYHRCIAKAMLKINQNVAHLANVIAEHFHKGGDDRLGSQYARLAGNYALQLYFPKQALKHFKDAENWINPLKVETRDKFLAKIWLGMAEAHRYLGDYQQAMHLYERSIPYLDSELKESAIFQLFNVNILQGAPLSIFNDLANDYEQILLSHGDSWALALFYWSKSFVALIHGNVSETRLQWARGIRITRRMKQKEEETPKWVHHRAISILMRAHNQWGNYHTAIRFAEMILNDVNQSELHGNTRAVVSASLGDSYMYLGKYQRSEDAFNRCYNLANKAGDPRLVGVALLGLAKIAFYRGDFKTAENFAQKILTDKEPQVDILRQMLAQLLLVQMAIQTELQPDHQSILENLLNFSQHIDAQPYVAMVLGIMGEFFMLQNNFNKAELCTINAIQIAENCRIKFELSAALRCWAKVKASQNDLMTANNAIDRSLQLATAIKSPYEIGLSLRTRAIFQQDSALATQDTQDALNIFKDIGAKHEDKRTKKVMKDLQKKFRQQKSQ